MNEPASNSSGRSGVFATTHWTLVLRAQGDAPEARAALGELCEIYWTPVFRFLRRDGRDEDNARELAQEFFARLLARGGIDKVQRERGRFRSFLLGAVKHFLMDLRRSEQAQKRGGGIVHESIESGTEEGIDAARQVPDSSADVPDAYFDRQWAMAVMDRALSQVAELLKSSGNEQQFESLKPWLVGDAEGLSQADTAVALGLTPGALKVAIHRLRKRFRDAVETEIAQTVGEPEEVQGELRHLIAALSQADVSESGSDR